MKTSRRGFLGLFGAAAAVPAVFAITEYSQPGLNTGIAPVDMGLISREDAIKMLEVPNKDVVMARYSGYAILQDGSII